MPDIDTKAIHERAERRVSYRRGVALRGQDITSQHIKDVAARFHQNYKMGDQNKCWEWLGLRFTQGGYGRFSIKGTSIPAHRAMMMLLYGDISSDIQVCHACDNPPCVNPNHLWLGSPLENTRDKISKGRARYLYGEYNHISKLTEELVRYIRKSTASHRELARQLCVDEGAIRQARSGKTWTHVR